MSNKGAKEVSNPNYFLSDKYEALVNILVDIGDIIPKGDGLYEDMGGHMLRYEHLEGHIESYLKSLSLREREALNQKLEAL